MDNSKSKKDKEDSKAASVYELIKDRILKNEFPPNEFISIGSLAEMIGGAGFTPTREAVQRLSDEQFLNLIPRKGIVIPEFDIKTMMDILELRFVIEKYATVTAAKKMTSQQLANIETYLQTFHNNDSISNYEYVKSDYNFHMMLTAPLANRQFVRTLTNLYEHSIRFNVYFLGDSVRSPDTYQEHNSILEAIKSGNVQTIEDAITNHHKITRQLLLDSMIFSMD